MSQLAKVLHLPLHCCLRDACAKSLHCHLQRCLSDVSARFTLLAREPQRLSAGEER